MEQQRSLEKSPPTNASAGQKRGWRARRNSSNAPGKTSRGKTVLKARRRGISLRASMAVLTGRLVGTLSRRLGFGGGTSIAGLTAQRISPDIVNHLAAELEYGSVMVTGTNGKTTTSGFIAAALRESGLRVWRNREGSNLMGGIANALVMRALPYGRLRRKGRAIAVFEVDEAVIKKATQAIPPRVLVFTNLFRDQLDRYGEVDSIATRWQQTINALSPNSILVLNADDPATANLGRTFDGQVLYFGIDDPALDLAAQPDTAARHQVMDTRVCPQCGRDYEYTLRYYSHLGHYFCPSCGNIRPQPDVRATRVHADEFDRMRISVASGDREAKAQEIVLPLPGLYNIYNALAAVTTAQALHIGWEPTIIGIEQFKPAFGRGERVQVEGRTLRLLLAKNPTGYNEVLRTLFSEGASRHVLCILNDNSADGRDVSWIWDIDVEQAVGHTDTLVLGGTRALDLALRFKYAGMAQDAMVIVPPAPLRTLKREALRVNRNGKRKKNKQSVKIEKGARAAETSRAGITAALDAAIHMTPVGETLFVIPTYTGLLEIHRELERRGLTPHYWEGQIDET
ncbi:MAG TPA: MurT ligase domain-containing protein [Ktedonobacteraceae bacterium]|nr:MurT ligase domain-containing protein [Ktedonobacteraceae bacterium]